MLREWGGKLGTMIGTMIGIMIGTLIGELCMGSVPGSVVSGVTERPWAPLSAPGMTPSGALCRTGQLLSRTQRSGR